MTAHVLLDLDGTLTDPKDGFVASISHALDRLGVEVPASDAIAAHIGPPLEGTLTKLLGAARAHLVPEAVSLYRAHYSRTGIYQNSVYEGIPAALEQIKRAGASIYLATSKPRVFAERILTYFRLGGYFSGVYGSELDGIRSNKGELIAYLLDREALDGKLSVMVGDRAHDAWGAHANGVAAIGVLWGYGSRVELESAGVVALCERPSELIRAVI